MSGRYADAVQGAIPLPRDQRPVTVERVGGNATTDFGAPSALIAADLAALTARDVAALATVLECGWAAFDDAWRMVPARARGAKPGVGRSPEAIRRHLLEADALHLAGLGRPFRKIEVVTPAAEQRVREEITAALHAVPLSVQESPTKRLGFTWTPRFVVRRAAWHAFDHAWELEDRVAA